MKSIELEKALKEIPDVHENRDKPMDYVNFISHFSPLQEQALNQAWIKTQNLCKDDSRLSDICLFQIVLIIEFHGAGVTSYKSDVIPYEKNIYETFIKIKKFEDLKPFIKAVEDYYVKYKKKKKQ